MPDFIDFFNGFLYLKIIPEATANISHACPEISI
jgi:hypothetical protein